MPEEILQLEMRLNTLKLQAQDLEATWEQVFLQMPGKYDKGAASSRLENHESDLDDLNKLLVQIKIETDAVQKRSLCAQFNQQADALEKLMSGMSVVHYGADRQNYKCS